MNRRLRRVVVRTAKAVALAIVLIATVGPGAAFASHIYKGHYHWLADQIAMRSCRLWPPGSPSLSYNSGGRIQADYGAYAMLDQQYHHFTQQHLPSWASSRDLCSISHSVSSNVNSYDTDTEYSWVRVADEAAYHGLLVTPPGTPEYEVWTGYSDELDVLFGGTRYFASYMFLLPNCTTSHGVPTCEGRL